MKAKLLLFAVFTIASFVKSSAQDADEETIKQTAKTETESYYKKDTAAWKAVFLQNEKITATYVGVNSYSHYVGWQKFAIPSLEWMKKEPKPIEYKKFTSSNYIINIYGNVATMEYDQQIDYPYGDTVSPYRSHEIRTLVKDNGQWKITSLTAIDTALNSSNPEDIENKINSLGYTLLNKKKTKDAIDVFKLNVKLFPKSWNVYDSLGEAYMNDGDNANAMKSYETSVKMNPKNEGGQEALNKLKKK